MSTAAAPAAPAAPDQQRCGPTTSNNYRTRLPGLRPGYIIAAGHVLAACAVTAVCTSAAHAEHSAQLPQMGVVFFALSLAVRTVLFRERAGATEPYVPGGVDMSLGASALFVANAAASVATMTAMDMMLPLIAYSALDVTANWLNMVASAKTPSLPRGRLPVLAISLGCDAYVASLISGDGRIAALTFPLLVLKSVYNVGLMCVAAKVVIDRDTVAAAAAAAAPGGKKTK
jgi:hypothetical protein